MFFLKEGEALVPTKLQVGDRIRVRPKQGMFSVWRPDPPGPIRSLLDIIRVRPGRRLWIPDVDGNYHQWLVLPARRGSDDILLGIIATYGPENFSSPQIRWSEEEPVGAVDGRFDYIAMPRATS